MITIAHDRNSRMCTLSYAMSNAATSVLYEGHCYVIISDGDSQRTKLMIDSGYIPLINIKSRTIRALGIETLVEIVSLEVLVKQDPPNTKMDHF